MTDLFSVHQFFGDETHECAGERLEAKEAVETAKRFTETVGARLGTTARVIIVDDEDFTVFEWQFGKGVTYPPR